MIEERERLEQKEAALARKEKDIDAKVQEKEEESRERRAAEEREAREKLKEDKDVVEAEKRDWEEEKEKVRQTKVFDKVVTLDVGGTKYRATLSTLTKYADSMLGVMFSGRHDLPQQEDGSYFIDRDGEVFKYILMYLRDRDHCSAILYDEDLHNPNQPVPSLSVMKRQIFRSIAFEAKYFQVTELETMALISLNAGSYRGSPHEYGNLHATAGPYMGTDDTYYHRTSIRHRDFRDRPFHDRPFRDRAFHGSQRHGLKACSLDYGQHTLECSRFDNHEHEYVQQCISINCKYSGAEVFGQEVEGTDFQKNILFKSCDLSGVAFCNLYFQGGVSFEGCILHGTKFERVGGLVHHKVHFTPWQVAQADFEPELLQALKDKGCIY